MKLNWVGRAAMNNLFRAAAQTKYVAPQMRRLGGSLEGGRALEVGCGRGVGVEIILDRFGARDVFAFDLDSRMIDRARRRLSRRPSGQVRLAVGDVTSIDAEAGSFDAGFDFGAIHLVPEWRTAIAEVRRVLKPGGRFYFELVTSRLLRAPYFLVTEGFRPMQAPGAVESKSWNARASVSKAVSSGQSPPLGRVWWATSSESAASPPESPPSAVFRKSLDAMRSPRRRARLPRRHAPARPRQDPSARPSASRTSLPLAILLLRSTR